MPSRIIDLIRDGVPLADLRMRGGRAVFAALCTSASSALQRGWQQWEWEELVLEPASKLGIQLRLKDGLKPRPDRAFRKDLDRAWHSANEWLAKQPPAFNSEQMQERARAKAALLLELVADPDAGLRDADRAVLKYAADQAHHRGIDRIALPRRTVSALTGMGERTVRESLRRLEAAGHLLLAEAGKPGTIRPRANLYRLADIRSIPLPERRSVGPVAEVCGTPSIQDDGTPLSVPSGLVGPPVSTPTSIEQENPTMVTLTLSAGSPEDLAAALALLQGQTEVQIDSIAAQEQVPISNVTQLPVVRRLANEK